MEHATNIPESIQRLLIPFDHTSPEVGHVEQLIAISGAPVVVRGEITLLSGPKKTFKSSVSYCIAAALFGEQARDYTSFERAREQAYKVMIIDTEQSRPSLKQVVMALLRRAGLEDKAVDDNLITYQWRGEAPEDMVQALSYAAREHHPDIIIIDGIADFVYDINDIRECRALCCELLRLAEDEHCGIISVIHTNPNSSKERGHLGTWLGNKAYGYITLSRTAKRTVRVSAKDGCRCEPFRDFEIVYDPAIHGVRTVSGMSEMGVIGDKDLAKQIPAIIAHSGKASLKAGDIVKIMIEQKLVLPGNQTQVHRALRTAKKRGLIAQKVGRGPYSLPD